ncbi:hypothetical protein [Pseudomonas luteola]|uniref:hypothetical protein n=1 Tax=Pseudomonas luteola TaxID=47886 RepID=UPI001114F637|nr:MULTISPECIES: hypothetical protein [Pseudomonas]
MAGEFLKPACHIETLTRDIGTTLGTQLNQVMLGKGQYAINEPFNFTFAERMLGYMNASLKFTGMGIELTCLLKDDFITTVLL